MTLKYFASIVLDNENTINIYMQEYKFQNNI